ncbi:hypothetical protein IFM89_039038 [Coptis chinensis]|uniref:Uncharacterized protein n=1 Tax=Coptis chinensis TaxID=261450 RepID=A0A835IHH5_9MAGN|nr:hypothetical protein IFM89_039038 [Coptis chinensis]
MSIIDDCIVAHESLMGRFKSLKCPISKETVYLLKSCGMGPADLIMDNLCKVPGESSDKFLATREATPPKGSWGGHAALTISRNGKLVERVPLSPPLYNAASFSTKKPSWSSSFQHSVPPYNPKQPLEGQLHLKVQHSITSLDDLNALSNSLGLSPLLQCKFSPTYALSASFWNIERYIIDASVPLKLDQAPITFLKNEAQYSRTYKFIYYLRMNAITGSVSSLLNIPNTVVHSPVMLRQRIPVGELHLLPGNMVIAHMDFGYVKKPRHFLLDQYSVTWYFILESTNEEWIIGNGIGREVHRVRNEKSNNELASTNVKALYRRAQAYIQLADLDLAEIDIKKALEIEPNNRGLCLELADLLENEMAKRKWSRRLVWSILENGASDDAYYVVLSNIYLCLGSMGEGEKDEDGDGREWDSKGSRL